MNDSQLDVTSSIINNKERELETYLFSRFIFLIILVTSYPLWSFLEEAVDISDRDGSFILNNFIYLSTLVITPIIYVFYKQLAQINNIELLLKWEKDHPNYDRIYWMNPLALHNNLSLKGKFFHVLFNSIILGSIIITTSLSISLILVFAVFESNLELILIIVLLVIVYPVMIGQLFILYDVIYSASGLYLFEGSLVIRSALIFRSLPDKTYKTDKLNDFVVKEISSFSFNIPMYHLKSSESRWSGKTLVYSDNSESMIKLHNTIRQYVKPMIGQTIKS